MTIQADAQGVVQGKFTIPAGIPAGTKLVRFEGSGGSRGQAAFVGSGSLVEQVRRTVNTVTQTFYDPLAQTFTLPESTQIAAVDLWFAALGTSNIEVQIRETANGFPTSTVVAKARITPAQANTAGHTRISFEAPVFLQANTEYALVALCDDAVSELRVAELGKWDASGNRWVTSQPYQIGVLLSSSNASTWTAHQDRDMTFRLHRAVYSQANRSVALGSVAVTAATDLIVLGLEEVPASNTYIQYELALPNGQTLTVANGQQVRLPEAITGNVTVSAKLYGSNGASPILFPGTQLIVGKVGTSGVYVSRAIAAGTNVRLKVVLDAVIPGGAAVAVSWKGVDAGDTWTTVPFVGSKPIDDGFYEITHQTTGVTESMVQVKLELTGTPGARPRVKNLRFMTI